MSDTIPLFSSHYSYGSSLITLEEGGKTPLGGPTSLCDLARAHHLKQVTLIDDRFDGYLDAFTNLSKPFKAAKAKTVAEYTKDLQGEAKKVTPEMTQKAERLHVAATAKAAREADWFTDPIQLTYGIRLVIVPDMTVKDADTLKQESRVVVLIKHRRPGQDGYADLIKLWNLAWTDGLIRLNLRGIPYVQGRLDWKALKAGWTDNLVLALPYFSSFLAVNTLTFASLVPDLPVVPILFKEVDFGLPFAGLLDEAVDRYAADTKAPVQLIKTVYYAGPEDFDSYITLRANETGGVFSNPNVDDLYSDRFSFAAWRALA